MPPMHPHTLHTMCNLQIFFPFEPVSELRKDMELKGGKLVEKLPIMHYSAQLEGMQAKNPRAGGKGRNGATSLGKGQFHSN